MNHHAQEPRVSGRNVQVREEVAGIAPHRVLFSSKLKGGGGLQEARRLPVPQIARSSSTRRGCESSIPLKSSPSYSLREQPPTASKSSSLYEPRSAPDHKSRSTTRPSWWSPKQYDHHEEQHSTALGFTYDDEFVQQQAAILNQIADDKKKKQEEVTTAGGGKLQSYTTATNSHHARASSTATPTMKASAPLVSIENDGDLCLYLLPDSEMIKEQRIILERIQGEQQQEAKQPISADPRCCYTRRNSARIVEDLTSRIHEIAAVRHTSAIRGSEISSSSTGTEKIRPCEGGIIPSGANNIVTKIGKQRLRIKGTSHTYRAIADGTATLVQCMSCKAILQVGATAKLLYCIHCQHVTPIELARYNHTVQPSVDQQIARAVQQQELDVACARKLSKMARSRDDR